MNRSAKLALLVSGAVLACVVALCGVALALRSWVPGLAECDQTDKPTKTAVITEKIRIEQLWPQLKPIQSVHWQEHEARARSCPEIGPMDYVMDGLAVITPERAAALRPAATPAEPPTIPDDLRPFAPPTPTWLRIADDLLLDEASTTVYFRHMSS